MSAGFRPTVGHKMKLYYNAGTVDTPTWTEICEIGDVSIPDLSMGLAELKRRCKLYTKNIATLIQSISVEFRLHFGLGKTVYDVLRAAFFAGTVQEYAVASGAIATVGTQAFRLPAVIESFPWSQPLEDVSGHDVRLAISYMEGSDDSEVDPSWIDVTA